MQLLETQSMELAPEILQRVMSWIELPDGSRRAFYQWQSGSQPAVATVLIVPGLGEHGGRYAESASHFTTAKINVCALITGARPQSRETWLYKKLREPVR